ncbi:uncharacterized protein LOC124952003 isoform X7 [Vespa velutina]|uniref:uncharacterized protein LOC124952003 isoform X7 n=1 Tax=Vespa velutina TaxID=202808 RepID=UPI001FB21C79|nr:uncharacterized protein LOC124952003 isoform X7 [Vespa velutina]
MTMLSIEQIRYGQQFRTYWRLSEEEYLPIYNSIGLKAALNLIYEPRIYVVVDEHDVCSQMSKRRFFLDILERYNLASISDWYEVTSIKIFSDLNVLKCALIEKQPTDDPAARFDHLLSKTSPVYTNETKKIDEQLKVLMKGFPEKKSRPAMEQFPKLKITRPSKIVKGSKKKPIVN